MSRQHPERPIAAVGVVVWKDDRVLLIRRAKAPNKGAWSLPGGAQHLGETVFECGAREVLEETGCTVAVTGLIDVVDSIHPDPDGRVRYHYTLIDVTARWVAGDPCPDSDADAAAWFTLSALDDLDLWSETRRIIDASHATL